MTPELAERFVGALYAGQSGVLELRTFSPDEGDAQQMATANRLRDFVELKDGQPDMSRVSRFLRECESEQLGAYFGVATRTASSLKDRKGDAKHCQALPALFVDADFKYQDEPATRERLDELGLPPSALIGSGGGLHPYWFMRDPILLQVGTGMADAKHLLSGLASKVADVADESVSEPVRVLRLPGVPNFKYEPPRLVTLEHCDPTLRYTVAEIQAVLGIEPTATPDKFELPTAIKRGDRHGILFKLLRSQKARGVSYEAAAATCVIENRVKCQPPLDEAELNAWMLRAWNNADSPDFAPAVPDGPAIVMRGGDLSAIVDRAETALLSRPIYQRGGLLTRTIKLDLAIGDGTKEVHREAGSTVLLDVREAWLVEQMGRVLRWYRENAKGTRTLCDPQSLYARTLLGRGEWRFPVLRGVVTAPTLARDGRVIAAPGFDAESGLLVDVDPDAFPPVPADPTKDDAARALARLAGPLRGFPFVDDAARSVALSALLTALVRVSLRSAPLHGYDAPTAGTGKSLLAEMAGLLATGVRPPALSQGKTDEEDEKRLSTVLFAGDPVIHIDNCERPISGDFLCSMLTQETVQARILGLSERRVLPSTALVLASGNNLTFAGDTSRRAVSCRLDAKVERPDTRAFDFDCHAEVMASRPELVVAGLTILRAYHAAGRPERLKPMGSFDDYAWIRGALVWLGCADPELTRQGILDNDPKKDELLVVMDLWEMAFGSERVEVADVARAAEWAFDRGPTPANHHDFVALQSKLVEVACKGAWNGKSVGWWLRRNKDRVLAGRSFRCDQQGGRQQWWLAGAGASRQQTLDNAVSLVSTVSSKAEPECNF